MPQSVIEVHAAISSSVKFFNPVMPESETENPEIERKVRFVSSHSCGSDIWRPTISTNPKSIMITTLNISQAKT